MDERGTAAATAVKTAGKSLTFMIMIGVLVVALALNGYQFLENKRIVNLNALQREDDRTKWAIERERLEGQVVLAQAERAADQKKMDQIKALKDKMLLIERDMTVWEDKIATNYTQLEDWSRQLSQHLAAGRTAQAESAHKNLEIQLDLIKNEIKELTQDGMIRASLEKPLFELNP